MRTETGTYTVTRGSGDLSGAHTTPLMVREETGDLRSQQSGCADAGSAHPVTRAAMVVVALALALAAVVVRAATLANATLLVNETFSNATADNPNWLVGGTGQHQPCQARA